MYQYYSWKEFEKDIPKIVKLIKRKKLKFDNIFGIPRGGLCLAVCLSHHLGVPLADKIKPNTLIVDDISDTGETLSKYRKYNNPTATIFCHPKTKLTPDVWIRKKENKWIVFPWEQK